MKPKAILRKKIFVTSYHNYIIAQIDKMDKGQKQFAEDTTEY